MKDNLAKVVTPTGLQQVRRINGIIWRTFLHRPEIAPPVPSDLANPARPLPDAARVELG